jgi:hypothetical protein
VTEDVAQPTNTSATAIMNSLDHLDIGFPPFNSNLFPGARPSKRHIQSPSAHEFNRNLHRDKKFQELWPSSLGISIIHKGFKFINHPKLTQYFFHVVFQDRNVAMYGKPDFFEIHAEIVMD